MSKYKFTCEFCGKHFVHEGWYLKHECEEMRRAEQIETHIGQAAWAFFKMWLTKQRRKPHGIDTFLKSRFYNAFIKFAEFVQKTNLPDHETFVKFVILKKYDPHMWTNSAVYKGYLEFLDRQGDPIYRAESTIKFIQKYTHEVGCDFDQVFEHITTPVLVHKIYSREISPWLILHSPKFWNFYKNRASFIDRIQIDGVMRVNFWRDRFKTHPKSVNDIKDMVKRLNL